MGARVLGVSCEQDQSASAASPFQRGATAAHAAYQMAVLMPHSLLIQIGVLRQHIIRHRHQRLGTHASIGGLHDGDQWRGVAQHTSACFEGLRRFC